MGGAAAAGGPSSLSVGSRVSRGAFLALRGAWGGLFLVLWEPLGVGL